MERECFENEAIAALMNDLFVCIKVDREERPDIDAVYMQAVQAMTGRGGWPLTVFLTPDLLPFYGGTFFPPADRGRIPGFPNVLRAVASAYRTEPDRARRIGRRIAEALAVPLGGAVGVDRSGLLNARDQLARSMDAECGGFGKAPKFAGATSLGFHIDLHTLSPSSEHCSLLRTALDSMAAGGIYDQLGGGFHRYSVDRAWRTPHFEKMLYDQAAMVDLYRTAWLVFREDRYREVALSTLEFVRREMRACGGAFFAAQDADSEGQEGRFFRWGADEIREILGPADAEIALTHFGICESDAGPEHVLRVATPVEVIAHDRRIPSLEIARILERAKAKLLSRRASRVAPTTDQKVLADWNGLMIAAMARSGRTFRRVEFVQCAMEAADHVLRLLWRDGRLFHFHADGVTRVAGFLDDYAFLGRALLEVHAATARDEYLVVAKQLAEILLDTFQDERNGGFYFSPQDGETILQRQKRLLDGAVPAGNSVAADFLFRLHALTGIGRYQAAAERTIEIAGPSALRSPYSGASLLRAALRQMLGYTTLVICAPTDRNELLHAAFAVHLPGLIVLNSGPSTDDVRMPVEGMYDLGDHSAARAYLCRHGTCSRPLYSGDEVSGSLAEVLACGS